MLTTINFLAYFLSHNFGRQKYCMTVTVSATSSRLDSVSLDTVSLGILHDFCQLVVSVWDLFLPQQSWYMFVDVFTWKHCFVSREKILVNVCRFFHVKQSCYIFVDLFHVDNNFVHTKKI